MLRICKLRKECLTGICHGTLVLTKRLYFLIFQLPKRRNKDHCAHLNWLPNWQLKKRRRSNTLQRSQRMGGGQNSLKNLRASSLNETNFSPIHLAVQYL
jgi:hypothetical protein